MIRKIVKINDDKCNGCGLCVPSCMEGALRIIDGKARLMSEVFCDGLGACLGKCPQDAISIEEREADEFDEAAVKEHLAAVSPQEAVAHPPVFSGCPGAAIRDMGKRRGTIDEPSGTLQSRLGNWPVQLMLVPPFATFLKRAHIVVSADCVPFAFADFHRTYLEDAVVVIGCPKLDDLALYRQKLADIFRESYPSRITILRMEVPCCGGLAQVAVAARNEATPECPLEVHTIGIHGDVTVQKAYDNVVSGV
jgi:Pyruvate/2-oxoacid:ferredoxin oxidoreductase delta subunit